MITGLRFKEDMVPGAPGTEVRMVSTLPEALEGAVRCGGWTLARRGALLQTVPGVARFRVTDGVLIEVAPEEGSDPMAVEQFLNGSVSAAVVHQRGGLPLHAACLAPPDGGRAIAIAGHSGAGKSTLAADLLRRGWSLLSDDVTPIYAENGQIIAWPGRAVLKLWRDACERLSIDPGSLRALPGERDKYFLPVVTHAEPVQLGDIFLLERSAPKGIFPIDGPERLTALTENTFKPNYLTAMECVESHFRVSAQIATKVGISRLCSDGPVEQRSQLLLDRFQA